MCGSETTTFTLELIYWHLTKILYVKLLTDGSTSFETDKEMYLFLSIGEASFHFSTQNNMVFDNRFMYPNWAQQYFIST